MQFFANLARRATMAFDKPPESLLASHHLDPELFNAGAAEGFGDLMQTLRARSISFGAVWSSRSENYAWTSHRFGALLRFGMLDGAKVEGSTLFEFDTIGQNHQLPSARCLAFDALASWASSNRLALLATPDGPRWAAQSERTAKEVKWNSCLDPAAMAWALQGLAQAINASPELDARIDKASALVDAGAAAMGSEDAKMERDIAERFPEHLRAIARTKAQRGAIEDFVRKPGSARPRQGL